MTKTIPRTTLNDIEKIGNNYVIKSADWNTEKDKHTFDTGFY